MARTHACASPTRCSIDKIADRPCLPTHTSGDSGMCTSTLPLVRAKGTCPINYNNDSLLLASLDAHRASVWSCSFLPGCICSRAPRCKPHSNSPGSGGDTECRQITRPRSHERQMSKSCEKVQYKRNVSKCNTRAHGCKLRLNPVENGLTDSGGVSQRTLCINKDTVRMEGCSGQTKRHASDLNQFHLSKPHYTI